MLKYGTAAALMLVATPAQASDWWFVGSSGSGSNEVAIFVDAASLVSTGAQRRIWQYTINETLRSDGIRKTKALISHNCSERTWTVVSFINYGNNDRVLNSGNVPSYSYDWRHVIPDSNGEMIWEFVCRGPSETSVLLTDRTPEQFSAQYFRL